MFGLDIYEAELAETEAEITPAGQQVSGRVADIGSVSECRAAAEACVATFGGIDVLGNIAGIANQRHVHQVTEGDRSGGSPRLAA